MNLELTEEQTFLREAARDAFSRTKTIAAAREALEDRSALPDLWPTAREAGWTGLLVSDDNGGAALGAFDAALVMMEAGRVLAGVALLGHLPASALADSRAPPSSPPSSPGASSAAASCRHARRATSPLAGPSSGARARHARRRRRSTLTGV